MQSLTDVSRLTGRYTTITTTTGVVGGTILAAGKNGISVSVDHTVQKFSPHEVVSVIPRG
jgi:hypothetical protein